MTINPLFHIPFYHLVVALPCCLALSRLSKIKKTMTPKRNNPDTINVGFIEKIWEVAVIL